MQRQQQQQETNMTVQILTPEFAISGFPLRSVNKDSQRRTRTPSPKRKVKRGVHFAQQLTQEYKIANRKCRKQLSVSTEELYNRVRDMRKAVLKEYDELEHYNDEEIRVQVDTEQLRSSMSDETIKVLAFQDAIRKLQKKQDNLNIEISSMKLASLQLKSKSSFSQRSNSLTARAG